MLNQVNYLTCDLATLRSLKDKETWKTIPMGNRPLVIERMMKEFELDAEDIADRLGIQLKFVEKHLERLANERKAEEPAIKQKRGGYVQPWHKVNVKTYTVAQQAANRPDFLKFLDQHPDMEIHVDEDRRDRPDPRTLPKGTPLCIADHGWVRYSCGLRGALGIDQGAVARLVEGNDGGMTARQLAVALRKEFDKLTSSLKLAPDLPSGTEWWDKASLQEAAAMAIMLADEAGLTQSQIGLRFGVKQVDISTTVKRAGLTWPGSTDKATPVRKSRKKSFEQLINAVEQSLLQLNSDITAAISGGAKLELDLDLVNSQILIDLLVSKRLGGKE